MQAEPDEVGTGGLPRMRSRRMLRRNSVSMIIENPVLAQVACLCNVLAKRDVMHGAGTEVCPK